MTACALTIGDRLYRFVQGNVLHMYIRRVRTHANRERDYLSTCLCTAVRSTAARTGGRLL
jgi:hypothetical protein